MHNILFFTILFRFFSLLLLFSLPAFIHAEAPQFEQNEITTKSGYFQLRWSEHDANDTYELQSSKDGAFSTPRTIYKGPDRATFISGKKDGRLFYRVRGGASEWSVPATVTVRHHSLALAMGLFFLGACLFVLTVWLIVSGNRQSKLGV